MGVYRRGKTWCILYYHDGRRIREAVGPNKRAAEQALAARKTDLRRGRFHLSNPKKITLANFATLYLQRHASLKRSGNRDERTLRIHSLPRFGNHRLTSITPKLLAEYQALRASEAKPATVNREIALLKTMFNLAIRWGYADKNPVLGLKMLREDNLTQRVLSPEEEARLLEVSKEPYRSFIVLGLNTGLRRGELLDLRWEDVSLPFGQLVVRRSKGGEPRKVPLNRPSQEVLRKLRPKETGRVFPEGEIRALDHHFREARLKARIQGLRIHDLRHTFASRLVARGADLVTVKDLLGHSVILTTMRYAYSRAHKQAVESLEVPASQEALRSDSQRGVAAGPLDAPEDAARSHKTATGPDFTKR